VWTGRFSSEFEALCALSSSEFTELFAESEYEYFSHVDPVKVAHVAALLWSLDESAEAQSIDERRYCGDERELSSSPSPPA
jgi:hypothetical protein